MKVLLDTHSFLWWITDSPRLSAWAREVIRDSNNELFFSAASGWEIAIKAQLGRLQLPDNLEQFIKDQLSLNTILALPIQLHHALHVHTLPQHHRDPFDRMLVAQSQVENLPILTADSQIAQYDVETIW
ncbi:MAG: type II toxin-antitoxin system VapC family toxin [Anaerolineae bacterium]